MRAVLAVIATICGVIVVYSIVQHLTIQRSMLVIWLALVCFLLAGGWASALGALRSIEGSSHTAAQSLALLAAKAEGESVYAEAIRMRDEASRRRRRQALIGRCVAVAVFSLIVLLVAAAIFAQRADPMVIERLLSGQKPTPTGR